MHKIEFINYQLKLGFSVCKVMAFVDTLQVIVNSQLCNYWCEFSVPSEANASKTCDHFFHFDK